MVELGWVDPIVARGGICAAVLGMVLSAGGGWADELPAPGETHRFSLVLLGRSVPLPPGEWTVVGQGYGQVEGPSPGPYGAIGGVMLVQQRAGLVEAMVLAHANMLPVDAGWGPAAECRTAAAVYATGVRMRARNLACAYVVMSPPSGPAVARLPAWAAGRAEALRRGWRLPGALAIAGVRAADRRDAVDVRYIWAAEPRNGDKPHVLPAAAGDPPRLRLRARALAPWVVRAMTELDRRIEDPLAPTARLPWPEAIGPTAEAPAGAGRWERRLGRAMTNRLIRASLSFGAGVIVTGSVYTAGILSAWRNLVDGAGGHVVNFGWEWEPPRPPMDFVADAARTAG